MGSLARQVLRAVCSGAVLSLEGCLPGLPLGHRLQGVQPEIQGGCPSCLRGESSAASCWEYRVVHWTEPFPRPGYVKVSGGPGLWSSEEGRGPAATFLGGDGGGSGGGVGRRCGVSTVISVSVQLSVS